MKQIELNLQKRLLIVEGLEANKIHESLKHYTDFHELKLICKGSELTEEIVKGLVPNELGFLFDGDNKEYSTYPDYKNINHPFEDKSFRTAKESFILAIEAKGYYWGENPFEKPPKNDLNSSFFTMQQNFHQEKEFDEAESRTFNPEKTLVFEIL